MRPHNKMKGENHGRLVEMRVIPKPANPIQLTLRFPGMECFLPVAITVRLKVVAEELDVTSSDWLANVKLVGMPLLLYEELFLWHLPYLSIPVDPKSPH